MCMICECERVCFGAHVLLLNNLRPLVNFGLRCGGFSTLLRRFWMQFMASSINSNSLTTLSELHTPSNVSSSPTSPAYQRNFAESTSWLEQLVGAELWRCVYIAPYPRFRRGSCVRRDREAWDLRLLPALPRPCLGRCAFAGRTQCAR